MTTLPKMIVKPKNRLAIIDVASVPPDRIVVNAVEGYGKTSLVSFAPSPAIIMARGETGYPALLKSGLVPSVPAVELNSWTELLDQLDFIATESVPYKTLALDAISGFERMCHEFVCQRDFNGVWGDKGFDSYKVGYEVSVAEWLILLQKLDRIRAMGIMIVLLSHSKVATFKNPLGPDYDRFVADCHAKTWSATAKWADCVFFGTFRDVVIDSKGAQAGDATKGRKKGRGGNERVLYTQQSAAFVAKNRNGMDAEITMPQVPGEMWGTLMAAMKPQTVSEDLPPM